MRIQILLHLLLTVLFFTEDQLHAQQSIDPNYYEYVRCRVEGDSLYKIASYALAAERYARVADLTLDGEPILSPNSHYNAACCYALSGQADRAFEQLDILIGSMRYTKIDQLDSDSDFEGIRTDPRWQQCMEVVRGNIQKELIRQERMNWPDQPKGSAVFYPLSDQAKRWLQKDDLPLLSIERGHYRIYFRGNSKVAARLDEVFETAEWAHKRALELLGLDAYDRGINLLILDSKEEMKELSGRAPGGGFAMSGHDLVVLNYDEQKVAPATVHEVFHLISVQTWGNSLRMILEGSAVYAQNECSQLMADPIPAINAWMLSEGKLLPIDRLIDHFNEEAKQDEVAAYFQSAGFFGHLYERFGPQKIEQLWKMGFVAAQSIFGKEVEELEEDWIQSLESIEIPADVDWNAIFSQGCQELQAEP